MFSELGQIAKGTSRTCGVLCTQKLLPKALRQQARGYKKTVADLVKANAQVFNNVNTLVRVDFNVPISKTDKSKITDDTRIREALPTIKFLMDHRAKIILASHSGRPKGKVNEDMRMSPMAKRLSELLGKNVATVNDCIGQEVENAVAKLKPGEILMLENARFHKEEEKNDPDFAKQLAKGMQIFVNDAFGTAHRAHATTEGVAHHVKHKVAGFLLDKEIRFLKGAVDHPVRPFAAIIGGAKVSTKITVIESLLKKCDKILLGGGMIFTFFKAQGLPIGKSLVEDDYVELAKNLMEKAKSKGVKLLLPKDVLIAEELKKGALSKVVPADKIPEGWMGLDIGPKTISEFKVELKPCKTVVWNGPMGVFEIDDFAVGTYEVAKVLAEVTSHGGITIVGGGDSVAAINNAGLSDKMSHISTGGGASLEMLEGKELPGVSVLDDL